VNVHHGDEAGKTKNCEMHPLPGAPNVEVILRYFHQHRSPRAARCGSSFLEWAQIAQGVGYEGIRWT
jgi:hypothetical protein